MIIKDLINYFSGLPEFSRYETEGIDEDYCVLVYFKTTRLGYYNDKRNICIYPLEESLDNTIHGEVGEIVINNWSINYVSFYYNGNFYYSENEKHIILDKELINKFPEVIIKIIPLLFEEYYKLDREVLNRKLDFLIDLEDILEPIIFTKNFFINSSGFSFVDEESREDNDFLVFRQYRKIKDYHVGLDIVFDCFLGLCKVSHKNRELITTDINKILNWIKNEVD